MIFIETKLQGAYIIEPEPIEDERGFFARTFCGREFAARGLNPRVAQCNISYNKKKGTLRGRHYQAAPHAEDRWARLGTAASTAGNGWGRCAVSLVVVAVVLAGGLRFFRATERTFADIIRMSGSAIRVANGAGMV